MGPGILASPRCRPDQYPERCLCGVSADRDCAASLPALSGRKSRGLYDPHGDHPLWCPGRHSLLPAAALQPPGIVRVVSGCLALLLARLLHRPPLPDPQIRLATLWGLSGPDPARVCAVASAGQTRSRGCAL